MLRIEISLMRGINLDNIVTEAAQRARHGESIAAVDPQCHLQRSVGGALTQHIEIDHMGIAILHSTRYD